MDTGIETTEDAPSGFAEGRSFDCPRCGEHVELDFYGPCTACREVLRATITADAREVDSVSYEPKMNVTPNAVATKD